MSDELLITRRNSVVIATFNRPLARNALTYAMYDGLAALCGSIEEDDNVLVITGAGNDAFAAGTDISQFRVLRTAADSLAYEARIEVVLSAIEHCRVPTIAAMAGACTGGGAAIAGCCDLRIGATNLRYGFPIARTLGNCLSAANLARLVALMGEARVKDMMLTARLIEAEEAKAIGLISKIVAPDALLAEAEAMAATIGGLAPLTIAATRRALLRQRPSVVPADDLVQLCYLSDDFREGIDAFGAKRRPSWSGR